MIRGFMPISMKTRCCAACWRWREARRLNEGARVKTLLRACRSNDPARIDNAYVIWVVGEGGPFPAIQHAEELANELERLQTALVQCDPDWRADVFERAVQGARRKTRRSRRQTATQALPALNP